MITDEKLNDVLTRHQIYVEGVKLQQALRFNETLKQLKADLRNLFSVVTFSSLGEMSRVRLNAFLIELRKIQAEHYNRYAKDLIDFLQAFMVADVYVSTVIYATAEKSNDLLVPVPFHTATIIAEENSKSHKNKLYPFYYFRDDCAKLWNAIEKAPVPANGALPLDMIDDFTTVAERSIENRIRKGYADNEPLNETLTAILGTPSANFRDGALTKIYNQSTSLTNTLTQHVTSIVGAGLASMFFNRYIWAAVLDGKTTIICRNLNGNVFVFGDGPLPPAHFNCRSKAVPLISKPELILPTYYAWIKAQPKAVQNDIFGTVRGEALRNGDIASTDLSYFNEASPLTIEEFKSKLPIILSN